MVYVLTLITQKSLLPFAFRRANGSMSRKDNGKEVREWVQSSFNCTEIFPQKAAKKGIAAISSASPLCIQARAMFAAFLTRMKFLVSCLHSEPRDQLLLHDPPSPLPAYTAFIKSKRGFPGHLVIWDRESKPACMLKKPPKSTVLLSIQ